MRLANELASDKYAGQNRFQDYRISQSDLNLIKYKLEESKCQQPLALCIRHLSTQPKVKTEAFVRELGAIGGCSDGRDNQIYFALLSVDSAALYRGSSNTIEFIPPRHSRLRGVISSKLSNEMNALFKSKPDLIEDRDGLKKALKPIALGHTKGAAKNGASEVKLAEAVYDALFPELADKIGFDLPDPDTLTDDDQKIENLIDRIRLEESFASLLEAGKFNVFQIMNAFKKISVLELVHHTDFAKMLRHAPELVLNDIENDPEVFQKILASLRFGDSKKVLLQLVPHLKMDMLINTKTNDDFGLTLIHIATEQDDLELIRSLFDKASEAEKDKLLELRDGQGNTPLLTAVGRLNSAARDYFIFNNANVEVKNQDKEDIFILTLQNSEAHSWAEMENLLAMIKAYGHQPQLSQLDLKGRDLKELNPDYHGYFQSSPRPALNLNASELSDRALADAISGLNARFDSVNQRLGQLPSPFPETNNVDYPTLNQGGYSGFSQTNTQTGFRPQRHQNTNHYTFNNNHNRVNHNRRNDEERTLATKALIAVTCLPLLFCAPSIYFRSIEGRRHY